ncbi:beta-glucuronosyltransferase GlcAT14C-like [Mangifera indica]|uniref:beta-glucuronosyltransferase GlcAT14C-like n=1 Tax=Mangifera indica TaxID=29780 RepID=UPI001CFA948D|nr:beta-glucuronosyltransferase GlcAT14C-like [Mangifera indica]
MGAEKLWLFTLFSAALLSLLLLLLYSFSTFSNSSSKPFPSIIHHGAHYPPAFGYYISGGRGDKDRIFRLLLATYHPKNRYLLHLGVDASEEERLRLVAAVMPVPAIRTFGNVDVEEKPDILSYMGSSNLAAILRAVAILLKVDKGWNWFVYLSAADYPLVTQDVGRNYSCVNSLLWHILVDAHNSSPHLSHKFATRGESLDMS